MRLPRLQNAQKFFRF